MFFDTPRFLPENEDQAYKHDLAARADDNVYKGRPFLRQEEKERDLGPKLNCLNDQIITIFTLENPVLIPSPAVADVLRSLFSPWLISTIEPSPTTLGIMGTPTMESSGTRVGQPKKPLGTASNPVQPCQTYF